MLPQKSNAFMCGGRNRRVRTVSILSVEEDIQPLLKKAKTTAVGKWVALRTFQAACLLMPQRVSYISLLCRRWSRPQMVVAVPCQQCPLPGILWWWTFNSFCWGTKSRERWSKELLIWAGGQIQALRSRLLSDLGLVTKILRGAFTSSSVKWEENPIPYGCWKDLQNSGYMVVTSYKFYRPLIRRLHCSILWQLTCLAFWLVISYWSEGKGEKRSMG